MSDQMIGHLIDELGVSIEMEETDYVGDVFVVVKLHQADGGVGIAIGASEGSDAVGNLGMVHVAREILTREVFAGEPGR